MYLQYTKALFFGLLFFLCSCENGKSNVKNELPERSELERTIIGEWRQNEDADKENIRENEGAIWKFDGKEVQWKNFTHQYVISRDTLYISGNPFVIKSFNDSVINAYDVLRAKTFTLVSS